MAEGWRRVGRTAGFEGLPVLSHFWQPLPGGRQQHCRQMCRSTAHVRVTCACAVMPGVADDQH